MSAAAISPLLTDDDIYLFNEGTWLDAYKKMGAHPRTVDGIQGTNVAVWAPGAERVSVIADFNYWVHGSTPLTPRGGSGLWEAFVPELQPGAAYKYAIDSRYLGYRTERADPYAVYAELRPGTASVVFGIDGYAWQDNAWMGRRATADHRARPMAIYEVHAGSWRRGADNTFLSYRDLAHDLVAYVKERGFTHIELLPLNEHPFDGSWGYQATGYYAPTSRFGTPHDLMYFVDHCHQNGIGVILDWVPGHFAKEGYSLGYFDGTHLYEHSDVRQGEHLTWGTYIFNYGRHEVQSFLLSNAHYWFQEYHIDGMRVDAVASMLYLDYDREEGGWVPNQYGGRENLDAVRFLQRFNDVVHQHHPGAMTCAEESTAWPGITRPSAWGGLGFDLKWNMGWMHDTLDYVTRDPLYRMYHQNEITFSFTYAFSEHYILPLSHDEVVHGKRSLIAKMPGDDWQRFATLRALYTYMYGHPGKKLLFMGSEFAQWREWTSDYSLDWHLLEGSEGLRHRQLQAYVTRINHLYSQETALHQLDAVPEGFAWIDGSDAQSSVVAVLRKGMGEREMIAMVANWTPVVRYGYRIGVPLPGRWVELVNSDDLAYGGSGVLNSGGIEADHSPLDGYNYSLTLTLPPLAVLWLKPE
ncbi:MAG: 1,4-alpha-glucan branching protein GlgB [Chloroflexota bacterium]